MYAIRTSLETAPNASEVVANYKKFSLVEFAFRTMKTISFQVRPIHLRRKERGIAYVFLCTLAYYVEFHTHKKLAPLLFADAGTTSSSSETKQNETGTCFATLMASLARLSRMRAVPKMVQGPVNQVMLMDQLNATQKRTFDLLQIRLK